MSRLSITNQPAPGADGKNRSASKPWTGVCARTETARNRAPRTQERDVLELRMDPRSEDRHRSSAVGVVRGVPQELEVARQPDRLEQIEAVEELEHALGALAERAVADEPVDAAQREVTRVARGDPAQTHPDAGHVEGAVPERALGHRTERERAIRGVEGNDLARPV